MNKKVLIIEFSCSVQFILATRAQNEKMKEIERVKYVNNKIGQDSWQIQLF